MGHEVEGGVVALREFTQYKLYEPYVANLENSMSMALTQLSTMNHQSDNYCGSA